MSTLPKFREFTVWVKSGSRPEVASATLNKLYRARARHKVARNFLELRVRKGSRELVRGYSAGMRLFLSYSAAEAMGDAVGKHITAWEIENQLLGKALRRIVKPLCDSHDVFSNKVRRSIAAYIGHEHGNVLVVATALRHLIAHGEFTPMRAGLMTKAGADAVSQLANLLLAESESRFTAWFKDVAGQ
jgi:hypothetical protein